MNKLKTSKLHFLLGTWKGKGEGMFPTIQPFEYNELITFKENAYHDLIHYEQLTWLSNKTPSHWECGFIRPVGVAGYFEICNVQGGGRIEILQGQYQEENGCCTLQMQSKLLENDPKMISAERIFTFKDNELCYVVNMAITDVPNHQHLSCRLVPTLEANNPWYNAP